MKKYIKKFEFATDANNYPIADIPFTTSIATNPILNLVCNLENKKIVVDEQGIASIVDSKPVVIYHTQIMDVNWAENYVEIEFEKGMTWSDFVNNSSYNDESKMTGNESCIGKFSIDGNGYVNAPFTGTGPGKTSTPQKGTDIITPNIIYDVVKTGTGSNDYHIYYNEPAPSVPIV